MKIKKLLLIVQIYFIVASFLLFGSNIYLAPLSIIKKSDKSGNENKKEINNTEEIKFSDLFDILFSELEDEKWRLFEILFGGIIVNKSWGEEEKIHSINTAILLFLWWNNDSEVRQHVSLKSLYLSALLHDIGKMDREIQQKLENYRSIDIDRNTPDGKDSISTINKHSDTGITILNYLKIVLQKHVPLLLKNSLLEEIVAYVIANHHMEYDEKDFDKNSGINNTNYLTMLLQIIDRFEAATSKIRKKRALCPITGIIDVNNSFENCKYYSPLCKNFLNIIIKNYLGNKKLEAAEYNAISLLYYMFDNNIKIENLEDIQELPVVRNGEIKKILEASNKENQILISCLVDANIKKLFNNKYVRKLEDLPEKEKNEIIEISDTANKKLNEENTNFLDDTIKKIIKISDATTKKLNEEYCDFSLDLFEGSFPDTRLSLIYYLLYEADFTNNKIMFKERLKILKSHLNRYYIPAHLPSVMKNKEIIYPFIEKIYKTKPEIDEIIKNYEYTILASKLNEFLKTIKELENNEDNSEDNSEISPYNEFLKTLLNNLDKNPEQILDFYEDIDPDLILCILPIIIEKFENDPTKINILMELLKKFKVKRFSKGFEKLIQSSG